MKYKAVVSGHIYLDEKGNKDIELLTQCDNDKGADTFCDIDHALIDEIDIGDSEDYYFNAIIESEWVESYHPEYGLEYEVEHEVIEIKSPNDILSNKTVEKELSTYKLALEMIADHKNTLYAVIAQKALDEVNDK